MDNILSDIQVFELMLLKAYDIKGDGAEIYRTSRELQAQFDEYCEPSLADISSLMIDLKCDFKSFYWVLHSKV